VIPWQQGTEKAHNKLLCMKMLLYSEYLRGKILFSFIALQW
jgi:hypothetical protein